VLGCLQLIQSVTLIEVNLKTDNDEKSPSKVNEEGNDDDHHTANQLKHLDMDLGDLNSEGR
jgi:hypothetical protein